MKNCQRHQKMFYKIHSIQKVFFVSEKMLLKIKKKKTKRKNKEKKQRKNSFEKKVKFYETFRLKTN